MVGCSYRGSIAWVVEKPTAPVPSRCSRGIQWAPSTNGVQQHAPKVPRIVWSNSMPNLRNLWRYILYDLYNVLCTAEVAPHLVISQPCCATDRGPKRIAGTMATSGALFDLFVKWSHQFWTPPKTNDDLNKWSPTRVCIQPANHRDVQKPEVQSDMTQVFKFLRDLLVHTE